MRTWGILVSIPVDSEYVLRPLNINRYLSLRRHCAVMRRRAVDRGHATLEGAVWN
jgi:hypothetical protein